MNVKPMQFKVRSITAMRVGSIDISSKTSMTSFSIPEALALKDRLVFMDFQTDQTENVFPMVQAGKGLSEMLLRSDVAAMNQAMLTGE